MPKESVTDVFSNKFSWAGVYSSVSGTDRSNSKQTNSEIESSCLNTALIDLKLGRFPDEKDAAKFMDKQSFSSSQSSVPRKRARAGNSNTQISFCQVEGCKKDLSFCKDYNKRHKVCEIHSKTSKVVVNGIEQRFCQQCSRFHLLSEFDDGKRSCRKRLAGHNERRRKNHAVMHSSRRLIPSYNGTGFDERSLSVSSYVCPDILHHHPQNLEITNWNKNSNDYKISSTYMTNMSRSEFDTLSLYQNTHIVGGGNEQDLNVLDESSSFHGLQQQPSSSSSCALSLLSSQSQTQTPSYISSNIPTSHYSVVQVSGNNNPCPTSTTHLESLMITDKYGYNDFIPGSSGGDVSTIDLLELSSHLHHVENQRQSMEMKQENDPFFGLRIT